MTAREGGFALIAVLLVLAMPGVVGAEFAYSMRLEATSVRAYKDGVIGTHLAEAAFIRPHPQAIVFLLRDQGAAEATARITNDTHHRRCV